MFNIIFVGQNQIGGGGGGAAGDMYKSVYDVNNNGVVDLVDFAKQAIYEHSFDYNSFNNSPITVCDLKAGQRVLAVDLIIDTRFDGGMVNVGIDSENDLFIGNTYSLSDYNEFNDYKFLFNYVFQNDDSVRIYLTGSATVGAGAVRVYVG